MAVSIDDFRPYAELFTTEIMGQRSDSTGAVCARKGREMAFTLGDPPLLTDSDVDALAWQFLHSTYADKAYADWPLDRRLDGFLRRRGLLPILEDGDAYGLVLDRVMRHISVASHSGFE